MSTPEQKSASYSYAECLATSYRINWTIKDVLGDRGFDRSRRWLPSTLSGADHISCLSEGEKIKLTHVEMGSYAHLFGFVEEFIAPLMCTLALDFKIDNRPSFDALTNFAAEEVKHMNLFREIRRVVDQTIGFPLALLDGEKEVARFVLAQNLGAALLLTACIEWFTQLHYTAAFKDNETLDPLTKHIFKCHWLEESQHAKMDHLETLRAFGAMNETQKDQAVDHLISLVAAVDGLLKKQSQFDVENLSKYAARNFTSDESREIYGGIFKAKRYCFIESGVTHRNFLNLFVEVSTPNQQEKVQANLKSLLAS